MGRRHWLFLVGLYVLVVAVGVVSHLSPGPRLASGTVAAEAFGRLYPLQYQSYLRNRESATNESKLAQAEYLAVVYREHPFAVEFNTTRGHVYALEDLLATARGKGPACITCKSAEAGLALKAVGSGASFAQLAAAVTESITCANCHNPSDMSLRLSSQALVDTLQATGRGAWLDDRNHMRSLVCAQCHVEYYCPPAAAQPLLPWGNGIDPAAIEGWYAEAGIVDWVHPLAGVPLLKLQHPEYETYQGGTHAQVGLSCADCHMPATSSGGQAYTSHWWTSPYNHVDLSCTRCHRDAETITSQSKDRQTAVVAKVRQTGEALSALALRLALASDSPAKEEARALYARAHYRWDWVYCENSKGFHNLSLAHELLDEALDQISQARRLLDR